MPLPTPCYHAHSQDYAPPPEWTAFSLRLQRAGAVHKNRTVAVLTNAELCWVARTVSAELKARKQAGRMSKTPLVPAPSGTSTSVSGRRYTFAQQPNGSVA